MKKALFFLLISTISFAQTLQKDDSGKFKLDSIVNSPLKKEFLYSNALSWLSSNFKDSRNVIETKDADSGEIIFKGNLPDKVNVTLKNGKQTLADTRLYFTGKIITKDEKFRIIFSDLKYSYITPNLYTELATREIKKDDIYNEKNLVNLDSMVKDIARALNKKADNDF